MTNVTLTVPETAHGMRLDQFLAAQMPDLSRAQWKLLIEAGRILLNGQRTTKPGKIVQQNDIILISDTILTHRPTVTETDLKRLKNLIIADQEHFIVFNKPAGLVVHPPAQQNTEVALTDLLVATYPQIATIGQQERPGIVHRLDKYTSGLLLVAKTQHGYDTLIKLFKGRGIQKTYYALVAGRMPAIGNIKHNILRDPIDPYRMICHDFEGRPAETQFEAITYYRDCTLIKAYPKTGRTHQIRVHCAKIGHPVLGDTLYGSATPGLNRFALHAYELSFTFDGTPYTFTAPLPDDFTQFMASLKKT
jgi:23S rRNA pseudouridine1911/1915/1917 synthase